MPTAALTGIRHNFSVVEKTSKRRPIKTNRRAHVVGARAMADKSKKWVPLNYTLLGIKTRGPVDMLEYLDR